MDTTNCPCRDGLERDLVTFSTHLGVEISELGGVSEVTGGMDVRALEAAVVLLSSLENIFIRKSKLFSPITGSKRGANTE